MKQIFIFCLLIQTATYAHAQQSTPAAPLTPAAAANSPPPLPPGPLLKPVPDNTRWTVITAGKVPPNAKPEEKAAATKTVVGEIMGKSAHILTINGNGVKEEQWTDGKLLASLYPGSKGTMYTTAAIDKITLPRWISAQNFVDVKKLGEKDYLIFRTRIVPTGVELVQDMENPDRIDTEKLKVEAIATIDSETRLPVAVKEGETTITYKFEPLAPGTEIIPAAIQTSFAEREKKMRDSMHNPVRP